MFSYQRCTTILILAVVILVVDCIGSVACFSLVSHRITTTTLKGNPRVTDTNARSSRRIVVALRESQEPVQEKDDVKPAAEATKLSLEEKMANWEASEEEIKAATLGGVVPQRADSFDVGLYVAFPFMVIGCLLFLAFPFIADKIDVSSVGPPPTS